ncbi:hypothetical protein C2E23DRAFT_711398, partial [Lenzites betulinus]
KPWYVTLGKGKSGKTQKELQLSGGTFNSPFPVVFKVPTEDLADEILAYQDAIKVVEATEDTLERVRLIFTLPIGEDILAQHMEDSRTYGLYAVAYGREAAVFTLHADAVNATRALDRAIWKKCPSFKRALAFMISGGQSEKRTNIDMRDLVDAYEAARTYSIYSRYISALTVQTVIEKQSARTSTRRDGRRKEPVAASRVGQRAAGRAASPNSSVSGTVARGRNERRGTPGPRQSPSPAVSDDTVANRGTTIYQHTRNLAGITRSHHGPVVETTKVPSCGTSLDTYLQAMGYDTEAKYTIADACYNSDNLTEFLEEIGGRGQIGQLRGQGMVISVGKGKRHKARRDAILNQRRYITRLSRQPYRKLSKKASVKTTLADKQAIADKKADTRERIVTALGSARDTIAEEARKMQAEFGGHDQRYYEHQILQTSRMANTERKTNRWNAYLRDQVKKKNDTLPAGAPRYSSTQLMPEIRDSWNAMSQEEKVKETEGSLKELDENKEMKKLSVQNVPISAFHDTRANLERIFEEIRRLHARTGIEIGLFAARSRKDHHTPPTVFGTSERVYDFFQITLQTGMDDVASSLEAYCLSGVPGLLDRSVDVIQDLQTRTVGLIGKRLGEATEHRAKKMFYSGFGNRITSTYGIVIEGWPLALFQTPADFRTRLELTTLLQAWENATARFRKLSLVEWEQWQQQNLDKPLPAGAAIIKAVSFAPGMIPTLPSTLAPVEPVPAADISAAGASATGSPDGEPLPMLAAGDQSRAPAGDTSTAAAPKPRKRRTDFGKKHAKRQVTGSNEGTASSATQSALPTTTPALPAQVPPPTATSPGSRPASASPASPT